MSLYFHTAPSIAAGLRMTDAELTGYLMRRDGRGFLTPSECRKVFEQYQADGYDVVPVCDNCDASGFCLGHEKGSV